MRISRAGLAAGALILACSHGSWAQADGSVMAGWQGAPPPFGFRDSQAVPVDFEKVAISYEFNVATKAVQAVATVDFRTGEAGYPMLDLVVDPSRVELDGLNLNPEDLAVVVDPDRQSQVRVLRSRLSAQTSHRLVLAYQLASEDVSFGAGYVRVGFFMDDLADGGRGFFERYGPASFEFDQAAYEFEVKVTGTERTHQLFVNGDLATVASNHWRVSYPEYYTTSSLYFHLAEVGRFVSKTYEYQGAAATIPVTVYADDSGRVDQGIANARTVLANNEATFGPYTHARLVIYVTPTGGGMEYCGATMTSLGALAHEITHSWFARGVMPANGNAGWIDEAVASWHDNGYPRASAGPSRAPVNLGGYSPYKRQTTNLAYSRGRQLLSELDFLFGDQGGLRPILRSLFSVAQRQTITVEAFRDHLERESGLGLTAIFDRYVYGKGTTQEVPDETAESQETSAHPRRYTKKELVDLR